MRLTLPHLYPTPSGTLATSDSWDALRASDPAFGFGVDRAAWEIKAGSSPELARRAATVASLLRPIESRALVSVGVGTAMLEFLLSRRLPDWQIRCGDFTPVAMERLAKLFPEATVEVMDLRSFEWYRSPDEVVLLYGVNTELRSREWKEWFAQATAIGIRDVVWAPRMTLTPGTAFREGVSILRNMVRRIPLARAGYLHSAETMRASFSRHYAIAASGDQTYLLKRR